MSAVHTVAFLTQAQEEEARKEVERARKRKEKEAKRQKRMDLMGDDYVSEEDEEEEEEGEEEAGTEEEAPMTVKVPSSILTALHCKNEPRQFWVSVVSALISV